MALLLLTGFAVAGPTGLLAWSENASALEAREAEIAKLTAKRDALRNRVSLLDPEAADPDLASQLVRDQHVVGVGVAVGVNEPGRRPSMLANRMKTNSVMISGKNFAPSWPATSSTIL